MELLLLFAFLAGVVTIISPCVLPVLPILLSTSSGGGRLRPLGIVAGLAVTFSVVTLAVTAAAQALALPATWLRVIAIVSLGFFGLTLLLPPLGRWMERTLSPLTRLVDSKPGRGGFWGGTVIGAGLGFLWAPCVGPIMASVIGLTAWAGVTPEAVAITLSYSLGSALPMLAIAYGSHRLATGARKAGSRSMVVQQVFGGLTVLACVALFLGADTQLQTFALRNLPAEWSAVLTSFENRGDVQTQLDGLQNRTSANQPAEIAAEAVAPTATSVPKLALEDLGVAPELTGITQWWNSQPTTLQQLRGKVVLIDFWTYGCYNCRNTLPYVQDLYKKYHDQGLEIIGVHTPELSFEYVPENVQGAIKDQAITWPVAFDPDYKTWRAYNNHYWPAFYFIDANGHIRYTHFGEGNYDYNEKVVQQLLADAKVINARTGADSNTGMSAPLAAPSATRKPQATPTRKSQATPTRKPQPTATRIPTRKPTVTPQPTVAPGLALKDLGQAPELVGLTSWINSTPLTLASLKGKVVVIDFWTFGCYNCANTRPYVSALYNKYHAQGLEIIGVHTPEFAYERVPANVKQATKDQSINWPVALDLDFKTWRAYNNRYWPAFYFIDATGHIRYTHFGEGNYDYNEKVVQQLLNEAKK